jgi:fatty acid desaturase
MAQTAPQHQPLPEQDRPQEMKLTAEQIELFGEELDALRQRVLDDLGQQDVDYIRKVMSAQRGLEVAGRGLLFLSFIPPAWIAGTAALSVSKILDNMEIGHNVMHGQYDWTNDPRLSSAEFEWDTSSPADNWRNSHNYEHHTFTNIVGKDRDVGYGILRLSDEQPWHPYYLGNLVYAFILMTFFEYGVAMHDLEVERIISGEISINDKRDEFDRIWRKVSKQVAKDYLLFPLLGGPMAPFIFAGNFTANIVRNVWSFMIIFCGHFPDGIEDFSVEETDDETRGEWYYRQIRGSGNLIGGKLFHIMSGNLSHQIEHHLFPDIPGRRYADMAVEVREACARFGIPYNTGPLHKQFGSVVKKLARLSLP